MAHKHVTEWVTDGTKHVKVGALEKERIATLKKQGAVQEAVYFNNHGVKTYVQFAIKKGK